MRRLVWIIAVLTWVLISSSTGNGQQRVTPSLSFEGVTLTLGMSETAVRQELQRMEILLGSAANLGETIIRPITVKNGQLYDLLGTAYFKSGKLIRASVYWPHKETDIDLANTFFSVAATWANRGLGRNCDLSTNTQPEQPGLSMKTVALNCPRDGRAISLEISDAQSTRYEVGAKVSETIFEPK